MPFVLNVKLRYFVVIRDSYFQNVYVFQFLKHILYSLLFVSLHQHVNGNTNLAKNYMMFANKVMNLFKIKCTTETTTFLVVFLKVVVAAICHTTLETVIISVV